MHPLIPRARFGLLAIKGKGVPRMRRECLPRDTKSLISLECFEMERQGNVQIGALKIVISIKTILFWVSTISVIQP